MSILGQSELQRFDRKGDLSSLSTIIFFSQSAECVPRVSVAIRGVCPTTRKQGLATERRSEEERRRWDEMDLACQNLWSHVRVVSDEKLCAFHLDLVAILLELCPSFISYFYFSFSKVLCCGPQKDTRKSSEVAFF